MVALGDMTALNNVFSWVVSHSSTGAIVDGLWKSITQSRTEFWEINATKMLWGEIDKTIKKGVKEGDAFSTPLPWDAGGHINDHCFARNGISAQDSIELRELLVKNNILFRNPNNIPEKMDRVYLKEIN